MSVPVNERSHGKLEACVKARELCVYTLRITVNPKIFKPEYQHALTDKIVDTALEIQNLSWSANNVLVNSAEDMYRRLDYQDRLWGEDYADNYQQRHESKRSRKAG